MQTDFVVMDKESTQSRRLRIMNAHLHSQPCELHTQLECQPTVGEFYIEEEHSVILPEKLSTGKWNVHRSPKSPLKLMDHWPDHPEIRTLHDNFLYAGEAFADNKCLGTRIREDGSVGEYRWMTYGEVGTARTAIGSGLVQHGIPKGSCVGLYMINRAEWVISELACTAYSYVSVPLYDTLGTFNFTPKTIRKMRASLSLYIDRSITTGEDFEILVY